MNTSRSVFSFSLGLSLFIGASLNLHANEISTQEAQFKAALIYKMGSYLSWIPPKDTVNYCFVGSGTEQISSQLKQRKQSGKFNTPIVIHDHNKLDATKLIGCDIIYANYSADINAEMLEGLPSWIFTISNSSQALDKGFIASIELYNKKPLLSISKNNLKSSEVSVNSRLLSYVKLR